MMAIAVNAIPMIPTIISPPAPASASALQEGVYGLPAGAMPTWRCSACPASASADAAKHGSRNVEVQSGWRSPRRACKEPRTASVAGVKAENVLPGVGGPLERTLQLHKDWAGSSNLDRSLDAADACFHVAGALRGGQ